MDSKQLQQPLIERFGGLYAENAVAKITRTAVDALVNNVFIFFCLISYTF